MATKINKKFLLVVTGFVVAAAVLLTGVIVVYQVYFKDPERNIAKGDQLMAEGKPREAYGSYGRAAAKMPGEIRYIAKMEEALGTVVADTHTAAREDYLQMLGVKKARTRARPTEPEQWLPILQELEDQAAVTERGAGWSAVEETAREMKGAVPADAAGAEWADIYQGLARAQRNATLSARERAELMTQLQALATRFPAEWRIWRALAMVQMSEVDQARDAGQADEAAARTKALDATLEAAGAALATAGVEATAALDQLKLQRLLTSVRNGRRVDISALDPMQKMATVDAAVKSALASERSSMLLEAAQLVAQANEPMRTLEMIDAWVQKHPKDLRAQSTAVLLRGQLAQYRPEEMAALRAAARAIVDQPQLPTSLNASMQENFVAMAIGTQLNAELTHIMGEEDEAKRAVALEEVMKLRAGLLKAAQNDENKEAVLAADAKIAFVKGDVPGAQRKWDAYFAVATSPTADVYLWAAVAARSRNDLSLALQYATKGMELNPDDILLALQRAELAGMLGRRGEEIAMLTELARALPDHPRIAAALDHARRRADSTTQTGGVPNELLAIEAAVKAGDCARARTLATEFARQNPDGAAGDFVLARVEFSCNDMAKAAEYVDAGLVKSPHDQNLWRIKAEMQTSDPVERVEILIKGVVPDPKRQAVEMLSALRGLRADMMRREQAARGPDPVGADAIKAQIDKLNIRLAAAEQVAGTTASDDPSVIESNFAEAVDAYQQAMQAGRQQDAQAAIARANAQLEAVRALQGVPELPIVFESTLLELQGKVTEALALVERARAAGRNEARLAVRLAVLQEKLGNEPAAFRAWQEAYERRANDANIVLGYARAMGRAGKGRDALAMLRAAADANPMDSRLGLLLAQYETTYGSRARAIETREDIARRMQPIPENVAGLYALLHMAPSPDAVKGPDGRPIAQAQWTALTNEQRGRMLTDTARAYQDRAEALYAKAMEANPLDIALAVQKARVMREQARFDEGTAAIQAVIDAAKARGPVPSGMYLDLGLHLLSSDRGAAADEAFALARSVQDAERREADLVLVEIEARRGRVKEAAEALERYLQTNPRLELQVRLCELLLASGEVDRAVEALQRSRTMAGTDPTTGVRATFEMLDASIAATKADQAEHAGNFEEAKSLRNAALAALGRAEVLQPNIFVAALRRVGILRSQAKSGGRLDLPTLELAAAEADRVLARNASLFDAAALRAGIELDKGDLQGAIGVLDRFLVAQPQDDAARSRLIALYREVGNRTKAVELARAAADGAPYRADWRELLGDLMADSGDHAGAAAAFERAYQIQPQVYMLVAKAMDERTRAGTPQAGLTFLQSAPPDAQAFPAVRAAQAVALHKLGRAAEAVAVAKLATTAARAAGVYSPAMQQVIPRLREIYGPDKTQELEGLMLSTGSPNAAEKVLLGGIWSELGVTAADKGIAWADSALAEGDSVPAGLRATAHTLRGNCYYLKGDMANAVKDFYTAAELEPTSAAALNNAAYISGEAGGDLAKSREFAERAVAIIPERAEFVDTLGYVLYLQAKAANDDKLMQRAEEVLKRSLQLRPAAATHLHMGMVQAAQGRLSDARSSYEMARKFEGSSPDLLKKIDDASKALQ